MKTISQTIKENTLISETMFAGPNKYKNQYHKDGNPMLWFMVWKYLSDNGEATKKEILTKLGLKPTSYHTMFAELRARNIIAAGKTRGLLVAVPEKDWELDCRTWNETHYDQFSDDDYEYNKEKNRMEPKKR